MGVRLLSLVLLMAAVMCASAQAKTAGDLLISCEALERGLESRGEGKVWVPAPGMECWHYMSAVQDLSRLAERADDEATTLLRICPPPKSTLVQLVRVFTAYARAHPSALHVDAASIAVAALGEAFPCPRS